MALCGVLFALFALEGCREGLTSVVETDQIVTAAVGEEACLRCRLLQYDNVQQVTWQKMAVEGEINLASFNKYLGPKVNSDRVILKEAGLKNSSIVIKRAMEEDEGCYLCLFNTYSENAITGKTCLHLYELHGPVLFVEELQSSKELVVSCSATGRPVPNVTLNVMQKDHYFSEYRTIRAINPNGTFTVTATTLLAGFDNASTQIRCTTQLLSCHREVWQPILSFSDDQSVDDMDQEFESTRGFFMTWIVVAACVCIVVVIPFLVLQKHRRSPNSDLEMCEPQTKFKDTDTAKEDSVAQETQMRLRTPKKHDPRSSSARPSSEDLIETVK